MLKNIKTFILLFLTFSLFGCYPNYKWEGSKSYYIDRNGIKHYVRLYYKGVPIIKKGKNIVDSVYVIK